MTTVRSLVRPVLLAVALAVGAGFVGGCAMTRDVRTAKANGVMGTTKIYHVSPERAWALAKTVLAQDGGRAVEEHNDKNGRYLTTTSYGNFAPIGTVMGAWVERFDNANTRVTFYTEQKLPLTTTKHTPTEDRLHASFAQALGAGK
ncbi:MAG: hypothetical protein JSS11_04590 [Verrucomicrobia bacterium]|nr:hypothetical protein [Verrucomicrobiota bacterium]